MNLIKKLKTKLTDYEIIKPIGGYKTIEESIAKANLIVSGSQYRTDYCTFDLIKIIKADPNCFFSKEELKNRQEEDARKMREEEEQIRLEEEERIKREEFERTKHLKIDIGSGIMLEMVMISAGSFLMGSGIGASDEKPVHKVKISKDYHMGIYQVTWAQWQQIMGSNSSAVNKGGSFPVTDVSWDDCREFIKKLNVLNLVDAEFRLPSEAEWEYACRGGTTTEYYWGREMDGDYCWYSDNSGGSTHQVGQKKPNEYGLYDMGGNVREWCGDWYANYGVSPATDPAGPLSGSYRVFRGGCWGFYARYCRSAYRAYDYPSSRYPDLGFRLVLSSKQ